MAILNTASTVGGINIYEALQNIGGGGVKGLTIVGHSENTSNYTESDVHYWLDGTNDGTKIKEILESDATGPYILFLDGTYNWHNSSSSSVSINITNKNIIGIGRDTNFSFGYNTIVNVENALLCNYRCSSIGNSEFNLSQYVTMYNVYDNGRLSDLNVTGTGIHVYDCDLYGINAEISSAGICISNNVLHDGGIKLDSVLGATIIGNTTMYSYNVSLTNSSANIISNNICTRQTSTTSRTFTISGDSKDNFIFGNIVETLPVDNSTTKLNNITMNAKYPTTTSMETISNN